MYVIRVDVTFPGFFLERVINSSARPWWQWHMLSD